MRFLALLLLSFAAHASPLDAWVQDWKAGKAFADQEAYAIVYAETRDREIRFVEQVAEEGVILAIYEAALTNNRSGQRVTERGIAVYYLSEGKIVAAESVPLEGVDMALTGQVADITTTAAGLSAGFVEANPIGGSPAGLLAMLGFKLALPSIADTQPLESCIQTRQMAAGVGWGAAAWNLGVMLANPVVGLIGAVVAGLNTSDRPDALRACALAKLAAVKS